MRIFAILDLMSQKRIGTIIVPPGVILDAHEKRAADFLAVERGADITFLVPNRTVGQKTPDIEMSGLLWEIKVPKGKGSRTIENTLRQATKQSPNVILDLRRMDGRVPTKKFVAEIERQFTQNRSIKHAIAITRQETSIDFKR